MKKKVLALVALNFALSGSLISAQANSEVTVESEVSAQVNSAVSTQAIPDVTALDPNIDYPETVDFGQSQANNGGASTQSFNSMATASSLLFKGVDGMLWEIEAESKTVANSKLYSASAQTALYVYSTPQYVLIAKGDLDYGSAFWDLDRTAKSTVLANSLESGRKYKAVGSHSISYGGSIFLVGTDYERTI